MKPNKMDGWQMWVEVYEDYVVKTLKSKKEVKEKIKSYLKFMGEIESINERTKKLMGSTKQSIKIIKESNIPKELLANLEFLKDRRIKQTKVKVLGELINDLYNENKIKEAKKIIDKYVNFIFELWQYCIHENTFKLESNFGISENKEIVIIDPFEITSNKEKVIIQINKKKWDKPRRYYQKLPDEIIKYFIEEANKKWTINNLNKFWGTK